MRRGEQLGGLPRGASDILSRKESSHGGGGGGGGHGLFAGAGDAQGPGEEAPGGPGGRGAHPGRGQVPRAGAGPEHAGPDGGRRGLLLGQLQQLQGEGRDGEVQVGGEEK